MVPKAALCLLVFSGIYQPLSNDIAAEDGRRPAKPERSDRDSQVRRQSGRGFHCTHGTEGGFCSFCVLVSLQRS